MTFNPGSAEAQEHECTCPVIDNNYGKGVKQGKKLLFWMTADCPLHGTNSKQIFKLKELEDV